MKELSIEEKAKAYDEAKLRMSAAYNSNRCTIGFMNEIFPELAELENDKIRKAIGYAIGQSTHSDGTLINGVSSEEALAWLEKQGDTFTKKDVDDAYLKGISDTKQELEKQAEQKPAEWRQDNVEELTEFENAMMHIGGSFFGENAGLNPNDTNAIKEQANLLLELVPKQEWSMYDETILKTLIDHFEYKKEFNEAEDYDIVLWLKSLRPQNTWKPSDEQMNALQTAIGIVGELTPTASLLKEIREQLKKLKE